MYLLYYEKKVKSFSGQSEARRMQLGIDDEFIESLRWYKKYFNLPRWSNQEVSEWKRLVEQGYDSRQIARILRTKTELEVLTYAKNHLK